MHATVEELTGHLGDAEAAENLIRWAKANLRDIIVPARRWRRAGHTGATLAGLYVKERSSAVRFLVVKILSPGDRDESEAHLRALDETPVTFRRHLVEQIYDPLLLPSGGMVTFQGLAGRSITWRPMGDLPIHQIPVACELVGQSLIEDWNPDFAVTPTTVADFLAAEVDNVGSVQSHVSAGPAARSPWLRTNGGPPVPNPLRLLAPDSLLATERLDILSGRVHGDLHGANAIMQPGNIDRLDTFVLVDLATYSSAGQLGRDLVMMLLSATGRLLPDLPEVQQVYLLEAFVRPDLEPSGQLPELAVQTLRAVYRPASTLLDGYTKESFRCQYLLSLVAHGLNHTAFIDLGVDRRWWFYRLAAYAARELLVELGRSSDIPAGAPHVDNAYSASEMSVARSRRTDRHVAGLAWWPRQPNPGQTPVGG